MKPFSFIAIAIVLSQFPLSAQSQLNSYMAISPDAYKNYNATCDFPDGYIAKVEIYVWVYHPTLAIMGAIFSLDYPDIVQPEDTFSVNEDVVRLPYFGDLENGIQIGTECTTGWNWLIRQTIWIAASDDAIINIVPHSDPYFNNEILCVSCNGPKYQIEYILQLYLNVNYEPCKEPLDLVVGTEESSWGCIKSLYRLN